MRCCRSWLAGRSGWETLKGLWRHNHDLGISVLETRHQKNRSTDEKASHAKQMAGTLACESGKGYIHCFLRDSQARRSNKIIQTHSGHEITSLLLSLNRQRGNQVEL